MPEIRLLLIDNLKKSRKKYVCHLTVQQFTVQDHALWMKQNFMPVNLFVNMHLEVTVSSAQLDPHNSHLRVMSEFTEDTKKILLKNKKVFYK